MLSAPNLVLKVNMPPSFLICCIRFCCLVIVAVVEEEESSLLGVATAAADRCNDVRRVSRDGRAAGE